MSTSVRRRERGLMFAACAVALATAVGSPSQGQESADTNRAIQKIERYCTTSWRNAGIRRQDWDDCTQQALVELLGCLSPSDLQVAIEQTDSEARRELNRAIWRLVQRCRRQAQDVPFVDAYAISPPETNSPNDWHAIEQAAQELLSPRQQMILDMTREGWRVSDIAVQLNASSERVSDEKYKAIAKLRSRLSPA